MRLSELRGHSRGQSQQSPQTTGFSPSTSAFPEQLGTIRNSVAYPRPVEALYQNQPVTILASGDIVGMSPACQIVDEEGHLDWVSSDDLTVTQRGVLPQSQQTIARLARNQRQSQPGQ